MEAICFTYPTETFSRFNFYNQKSSELQLRYKYLKDKTNKDTLQPIRFVRLYLCKSSRSKKFPIEINDLLENWEKDKEEIGETIKYDSLTSFVKSLSAFENSISLLFVDSNSKLDFVNLQISNLCIIFIDHDDDAKTRKEVQDEGQVKITTAKKGDVSTKVNYLLERSSLAPLKKIAEDCYEKIGKERKALSSDSSEDLPSMKPCPVAEKNRKVETDTGFRSAKPSTSYQNGFIAAEEFDLTLSRKRLNTTNTRSKSRSKFQALQNGKKGKRKKPTDLDEFDSFAVKCPSVDLQGSHVDTKESLLEAILALYRMSKVPNTDRPNVPSQTYKVSKELRDDLFKICPSIKRMGYRYRTFTIYATKPDKNGDEVKRNSRIESVLRGSGIDRYAVVPCQDDIIPLMHVGAKIEARPETVISLRSRTVYTDEVVKCGTLGCIAGRSDGRQCGLLSKHVAKDCSDVYYVNDSHKERLGTILPETNRYLENSLDISATLIDENVDEDKRKFKNIEGHKLQGTLYHYEENEEDEIFGMGNPVFIRGASSNPGKGEITMPFVDVGLSTSHIQVEDTISSNGSVQGRFSKEGDSGAIVCADYPDDCVHAVGMLIGTTGKSSMTRRKYIALPLSKGIEQLEDETGTAFNL